MRHRPLHAASDFSRSGHLVVYRSEQPKAKTARDTGAGHVRFVAVDVDLLDLR
jgi:hypothetical protein